MLTSLIWRVAGAALVLMPAAAQSPAKVSFSRDIAPVLAQKCMQCHGQTPLMGNLDLRTRETALKGGQHGPAVVPGDAAASHLYRHLTGQEKPQMPLGGITQCKTVCRVYTLAEKRRISSLLQRRSRAHRGPDHRLLVYRSVHCTQRQTPLQ